MIIVSGSYQNYKNGAVSNQLANIGRGGGGGGSESVDVRSEGARCTLYMAQLIISPNYYASP
jgi:hypothetical protein